MKKIIALLMIAVFCFSLVACDLGPTLPGAENESNDSTPAQDLAVATPVTVNDYAKISLFKVTTGKKVTASMGDSIYYENDTAGETYVDIVLDFTNLTAENIDSEEALLAGAIGANGQAYTDCLYLIETSNAHNLSRYENIAPLSTVRLHCTLSIPESETSLSLRLNINKQKYAINYTLGETISSAKPIGFGETIEAKDYATLQFIGTEYTDDLCPSDTSSVYSHYEIDNPINTYLVVKFDITNLTTDAKESDSFVGIKAQYMNRYTYTGFTVVEDEDQKGFDRYEDILPLSTRHFYCLIEVPKAVTETDVSITIAFNGQEYIYHQK